MENGLFIFRRDLRIFDNKGLTHLQSKCKKIYPIFIFTPEQITTDNKFRSENALQFMFESLKDLEEQIGEKRLLFFYGNNEEVVKKCIKQFKIDIVCFNMDCSPYSIKRDESITKICQEEGVKVETGGDYYLNPLGSIKTATGLKTVYKKFTPYYNTAIKREVDDPILTVNHFNFAKGKGGNIALSSLFKQLKLKTNKIIMGGRAEALKKLADAKREQHDYAAQHNTLNTPTSKLGAYIKFGCVSIREVYKELKGIKEIIRQLYWRDFFANILYAYPEVLEGAMKPKYNELKWSTNKQAFELWKKGETGFPVVDAGMRELNNTGFMHNRARLLVASFLIKTLLINWQEGEKYFASKLTDYDPASNNLNWQWCASSAVDSQPYFRIFNPWLQSKAYDPDAEYIKKWIPELADVLAKDVHIWFKSHEKYPDATYPKPIVSYEEQKDKALQMYKNID